MAALAAQWLRFALVGLANTALSIAVYALLDRAGLHYLVASSVAFVLGALNT